MRKDTRIDTRPSHDRDFRTLCFRLSEALSDLQSGRLRIFDIGRGADGYEVAANCSPTSGDDDGAIYTYSIALRHHMRLVGIVSDCRSMGIHDWESSSPSVVRYPVVGWAEFAQHHTESDVVIPTPCL